MTSADVIGTDEDQPVLDGALAAAGCSSEVVAWDDETVDWDRFALIVVRSTWDYAPERDAFCAWADAVDHDGRLHNPAEVIRWNTDKRYMAELEAAGVPITPTTWLEPGDEIDLPPEGEIVVKPTISAGSRDTTRHDLRAGGSEAHAAVRTLLDAGRSVMVQPYLPAVDDIGETGIVHIDGVFHHGFRKAAILRAGAAATERLYAPEEISPVEPVEAERALATKALDALPAAWSPLLYARVDMAHGAQGEPVLMELELVEPSLFFLATGQAADALVAAILRRCERAGG